MSDKFPWKIYFLYCIAVLFGFSLIGTVSVMRGPDHGTFQDEFGLGLTLTLFSPGVLLVALVALPITLFHDFLRNRTKKKNQEPPAEFVHIQTNYERPPVLKSDPRAMTLAGASFVFYLIACFPIAAFLTWIDDRLEPLGYNLYIYVGAITAIGGFILSGMAKTTLNKVFLFLIGATFTFPICWFAFLVFGSS